MRKSIVIIGIIMAFILGSLVSAPSVTAPTGGAALLAEQVTEIEGIIRGMQDELNNLHVPWGNVTAKPVGFATDTNPGGIFQNSSSTIAEPCNAGDTVTWDGAQWVCADIGASIAPNVILLHYAQSTEVELQLSEFIIFAEWEIVKTGAGVYNHVLYDSSVYANIEGNVEIGWYRSDDGTTWDLFEGFSVSNTTFETKLDIDTDNFLPSKYSFIAFAAKNTVDEAVLGKVKDFSGTVTIHLPGSESLVKLP